MNRRKFLMGAFGLSATTLAGRVRGQLIAPPASETKVAALVTTYHKYSHADNLVTRFMEGYSIVGKSFPPPCKVASLYIEQVGETDLGTPLAKQWKVPLVKSIADALTLGGDKLAVDGVLLIAEHGDYPLTAKGQKQYPRRRFFEEVVKVFRASKRVVPVFNDKHLAYNWTDAKWMYDQAKELGIPMMAGSSVPVAWRRPDLRPEVGVEWERALAVGYGHPSYAEAFGYHALEGLQVMAERRKGGEIGVKAVQYLEGKAAWEAVKSGKCDRALLDAALGTVPVRSKGKLEEEDADALVYLIEYRDGLQAAAYISPRHCQEFAFAGRVRGQTKPLACWYDLPKPQRDHFSFQVQAVAQMMVTGKPTYLVERTLLTTGLVDAILESRLKGQQRIETPELAVKYAV
ncbi:hypothetical protein AYO44_10055 [Planctomycetaceae bacterium SCGC AG-212-F19]|nr:hypothetical protein AYO44_10055 [Planctomycetaceae bacterium SCGC AG-212-F19]